MNSLLEICEVSAGYGDVRILNGVSVCVSAGSITALMGSNGAGKTTLMRAISGLLPVQAGRLLFEGIDISAEPPHQRVGRGIVLVPEGRLVFPEFTVEENLRIGAYARHARPGTARAAEEVYGLFPQLKERRRQLAESLSGGEQQMLALGRGLMSRPRLLLLDEPSLGLAPGIARQLFGAILRIREAGLTIFIVEQDVRSTLEIADRAYVIENGRVALEGPGRALLDNPTVKEAYLGL